MTYLTRAALLAVLLIIGGCAQWHAVETRPLQGPLVNREIPCDAPSGKQAPPYDISAIRDCTAQDTLVVFAFSGGGIRSAAFGYGALTAAHGVTIPDAAGRHSFDKDIDVVSGVSGGSFTAAAFATHRGGLFPVPGAPDYYRDKFLTHNFFADLAAIYLAPWHWQWMLPDYASQDEMAKIYAGIEFSGPDDKLFAPTFGDLADKGRPYLVVQATDYGNEQPFTFTQPDFDLICSDLDPYPVGNAVAASSAFPVLFSPIRLTNHHFDARPGSYCARHRPVWIDNVLAAPEPIDLSRLYARARVAESYLPPKSPGKSAGQTAPHNVFLQDGGVVDNVALRGLTNIMVQNMGESAETPWSPAANALACRRGWGKVRRVLILAVDGEAQPDNKVSSLPYLSDLLLTLNVTSSAMIDANGFETMLATDAATKLLAARLSKLDCAEAPAGHEVKPYFSRVTFQDLAEDSVLDAKACGKAAGEGCTLGDLARSGTSLDFSGEQVDALIAAGRSAFTCNRKIAQFLADAGGSAPGAPPLACRVAAGR